jgi:hypothetical protein
MAKRKREKKGENVEGRFDGVGEDILTVFCWRFFSVVNCCCFDNYLILTMHQNNRKIALWNGFCGDIIKGCFWLKWTEGGGWIEETKMIYWWLLVEWQYFGFFKWWIRPEDFGKEAWNMNSVIEHVLQNLTVFWNSNGDLARQAEFFKSKIE